jgi:hypothetical protein
MEELKKGDTVEFEDAYTAEVRYGRIERMWGDRSIIRIISREEAGPHPKRFKPRPACGIETTENGIRLCSYHRVPLIERTVTGGPNPEGLGHFISRICPVSNKEVHKAEGL